jgi:ABC-type glycerol-3-phosphate transport system substrate-binding protein
MAGSRLGRRAVATLFPVAVLTFALAGAARPAATVTISMLAQSTDQAAFDVLIPNFERVYPDLTVAVTYIPSGT